MIIAIVFLLAANAFFVAAEFALVSVRRSDIETRTGPAARVTLAAMEKVSLMMAGAQLGITICSLGLGYLGEPAIAHALEGPFATLGLPDALIHPLAFAIALALIGFLHVVLGEMVPKNIALAGPDRAALLLAPPLTMIVRALHPAIALLNWIANRTLRAVGVQPRNEVTSAFTRDEVAGFVHESRREGLLDDAEERLLIGALEFEGRDARSVLLPLDALATLPPGVRPAEVEQAAARTGFSRFPVRDGDDLIGYVHLKDAIDDRPVLRELAVVQATDGLRSALATMQRANAHLARVEEHGAVIGVVALEDVLEELVGEIRDEAQRLAAA
jgi:CBS domain containing-hemolysin-like protein